MSFHEFATIELGIHGVVSREYANAAQRLAEVLITADEGRVVRDGDTKRLWVLRTAPADWLPLDGGAIDVAFATAVLFTAANRYMAPQSVSGALAFTVNSAGAVKGASTYVRLVSNGSNVPTFTGMKEHGSSMGYNGAASVVNLVEFWYDGTDYFYAITQPADPPVVVTPSLRFADLTNAIESGSALAGWNYANSGTGDASLRTPDKTLAASTDGYFRLTTAGHTPSIQNSALMGYTLSPAGATTFGTMDFLMYGETASATGKYKLYQFLSAVTLNGDANVVQAVGDIMRARRSGTSLIFEVSKNAGSTWTVIHTFASVTAKLYPSIIFTGPGQANALDHSGLT